MCLFLDDAIYCAEKLLKEINLPHLMPDDDNFGGSSALACEQAHSLGQGAATESWREEWGEEK